MKKATKTTSAVVAAIAASATFGACGFASGDDSFAPTLSGTFTLFDLGSDYSDPSIRGGWSDCEGTGGYSDFGPGMNVTVTDGGRGAGNIIATTTTRSLTAADAGDDSEFSEVAVMARDLDDAGVTCSVVLEPVEIPVAEFYEVEVGRRGAMSFSYEELAESDFVIELSLGDLDV